VHHPVFPLRDTELAGGIAAAQPSWLREPADEIRKSVGRSERV
jgi:hypothetical protein